MYRSVFSRLFRITGLAALYAAACSPSSLDGQRGPASGLQRSLSRHRTDSVTISTPFTVINAYAKVKSDLSIGARSLTINSASAAELAKFAPGDVAMVMQGRTTPAAAAGRAGALRFCGPDTASC